MKEKIPYFVSRPIRGHQYFLVNASSKAEAKRLVNSHDESIEAVEFEIEWHGKANGAVEGE